MEKQKRILIVRPDRIGDVVLSTPLPREIKKHFPDSFVAVLLRKYTRDIYENNPNVDKIILLDDKPDNSFESFWKKTNEVRQYRFTHSLTLLPTERLNYLLFFAGIPYRVGVGHKLYQALTFTRYVSRNKYIPLRHESDYCMDLARKIGVVTDNLDSEIHLTDDEKKKASELRNQYLSGRKFLVGIHSTSGNSAPNWGEEYYMKLIELLRQRNDVRIAVTDNNIPVSLNGIPDLVYPNSASQSLRESIVNFASLDLLISASTGPMHICAALKIKTLSMFCPLTACSPQLWGPVGNKSKIILPSENYCNTKCPGDPKKCKFEGVGGIEIERVFNSVNDIIG